MSWTGAALVLEAASPAPNYATVIKDQRSDRVRVDFEWSGGDDDSKKGKKGKIEVRYSKGQFKVSID